MLMVIIKKKTYIFPILYSNHGHNIFKLLDNQCNKIILLQLLLWVPIIQISHYPIALCFLV